MKGLAGLTAAAVLAVVVAVVIPAGASSPSSDEDGGTGSELQSHDEALATDDALSDRPGADRTARAVDDEVADPSLSVLPLLSVPVQQDGLEAMVDLVENGFSGDFAGSYTRTDGVLVLRFRAAAPTEVRAELASRQIVAAIIEQVGYSLLERLEERATLHARIIEAGLANVSSYVEEETGQIVFESVREQLPMLAQLLRDPGADTSHITIRSHVSYGIVDLPGPPTDHTTESNAP